MLPLSTIRQDFDSGFNSVLSLVEDLEQQIESLTLANHSPNHLRHLEHTISSQKSEIKRLTETVENKSKYDQILEEAESVIRGSPELLSAHLSAATLHRRLVRHKDKILMFMTDFTVPC